MGANNPTGENGRKQVKIIKDSKEADDLLAKFFEGTDYSKIHCNCVGLEIPKENIKFKTEVAKKIEITKARFAEFLNIRTENSKRKEKEERER